MFRCGVVVYDSTRQQTIAVPEETRRMLELEWAGGGSC
jgi:hypothetical protein